MLLHQKVSYVLTLSLRHQKITKNGATAPCRVCTQKNQEKVIKSGKLQKNSCGKGYRRNFSIEIVVIRYTIAWLSFESKSYSKWPHGLY